jgi:hypothetical protein
MRVLGAIAVVLTALSFLLWALTWTYWNFLYTSLGVDSPVRYVAMTCTVVGSLFEYLAIGLVGIGLLVAAKKLRGA